MLIEETSLWVVRVECTLLFLDKRDVTLGKSYGMYTAIFGQERRYTGFFMRVYTAIFGQERRHTVYFV